MADHCQLSCRPGECRNAARSAAFDRVAAARGANVSTAAKPEGEAAVGKKGVEVEETEFSSSVRVLSPFVRSLQNLVKAW